MRAVVQRVLKAEVKINEASTASINKGLLIFLGIETSDNGDDVNWLAKKILQLRIFNDENEIPNLNVFDIKGDLLLISQFTLHAKTKKGNRPSYINAARPEHAIPLYEAMIATLETEFGKKIKKGTFGADMKVSLINDGPFTIIIDTKNKE